MRPIVDARVDDAPLHNSARDRFVFNNNGGTTTTPSTSSYQNHHIDDDVAPKKPFGLVRNAQSEEREMVFPANPLLSNNVSMTPTPRRQNHHHHQAAALKCLDANAILMATVVSATKKRSRPMPTKKIASSLGEETPLVRETFTPEMSSSSSSSNTFRDGPRNNRSKTTTNMIPTSPVLSLLRTMFASWNYPNNGTTVISAEDILSPSADMSKFECGRTPKSSPADLINDDDVKTHETTFANAVFISEASKRLQKMCNDQRTRALLDASANGISPGSSRILIDKYNCFTDSSDEEVESVDSSPEKEEVKQEEEKQEVPVVAPVVAAEEEEEEKEEEDAVEYSVPPPVTPTSITMPTRALFSSPGKASLTDDDDDFENEEKLEMTMDEGEYYTFFFSKSVKTAIRVTAERYIRAAKRCSGDKVARENFCYKLWHHEAFSELFLSATLTAMCKLSLRMKSAFWNDTKNDGIVGAVVSSIKIENAYFTNYYANQIGKYLGTAMTIASPSSTPPSQSSSSSSSSSSLHVMNNYDDKFIYSCVAYAIAYVFVHCLFFLFHRGARDADAQYCYWKKKVSLIRWKATHAFTPVKRFVEKKKARWCLVYGRVKEEDVDPSARAKTEFCDLVAKTP